ncbi:calcium-binding protein, putative [Bodo saltans]|uniref:Calcium-binding protein, putative n=1 Tax=Bodo saltans TaxID=75058 RepID=A0A0S4J8E7_BODSA|nr:calcium-binding protein, putative [Bodo saltans]|eukprot:CUG86492.1 calcium-binding protein, putative [Bodo saltans]
MRASADLDAANSSLRRGSPGGLMEASTSSAANTPRRPGDDGRPSRSPSPANSRISEDSRASMRVSSTVSGRGGAATPASTTKAAATAKPRYAGYQDIPRFYFVEGKPQTQSTTLIGPHSKKHENPHLTLFEGVAVPVGAQAQLLLAQQQMQGGTSPLDLASLQPQGPKLSPMLPLAVMEDEDVLPFIQREFARLPAPPAKQVIAPAQQRTKGASVLRRPTTSSTTTAPSKQEQAYRQALTATMHRVCTQAFGLPKYMGQLVFRKLSADAEAAGDEGVTGASTGRPGTSSGSQSSSANSATPTITVAMVKDFYEKHLRFKSIIRRMFEVLIATSKSQITPPVSTFSGALGGMAPSALAAVTGGAGSGGSSTDNRRNYLVRDDFTTFVEVLLESHPGLGFLRQTQDFQGKYLETVIIRVFYDLDRLDRGKISWPEFENSKLPDAIRQVDATDDINTVLNYFSYEHFYVLYCRFWELDEDRDMLISQQDLQKYSPDGTMNPQIVERVFQGHGRKLACKTRGKMNYEDFVWFCLCEEDKTTPKAIRFWFRVLDLDGDGVLCGYEMEQFYGHTKKQLLQMTTEGISFADVLCQVSDMLPFSVKRGIRLGDLLAVPQAAHVTFNMIMNVIRFLQFEQRDPFVAHHERLLGGFERNDWDRFARQEYDRMAQEADGE